MATVADDDLTLCRGNNPGDGCNGEFPNKKNAGLCLKCQSLEAATGAEEESRLEVKFLLLP